MTPVVTVVCAWCPDFVAVPGVSHGICAACFDRVQAQDAESLRIFNLATLSRRAGGAGDVQLSDAAALLATPRRVVHAVSAWSGTIADESPICGADKDDPTVWGHRTTSDKHVTCPTCAALLRGGL